jgi:hypothetical protein
VVELSTGEIEPGFAVHILNYTNPAMPRDGFAASSRSGRRKCACGGLRESACAGGTAAAEMNVPFRLSGVEVQFTVPRVVDYEIAAVEPFTAASPVD